MLFFLEIPVAAAWAETVSGDGIVVGIGEAESGGGVDEAETDKFLGEVGGGCSILLLAPLIQGQIYYN